VPLLIAVPDNRMLEYCMMKALFPPVLMAAIDGSKSH
jgi:hypothetical protein